MWVVLLVVMLVVVLFILPPWYVPIVKDIHDGSLNECLGIVYIPIKVLRGAVTQDYF